jgi:outer membrane protein TolC
MKRYICCWCLALAVCGGVGRAAAPPVAPAIRSISLAEAAKIALENEGYRLERAKDGSLQVSHPARLGSLEALRLANQRLLNVEVAYWNLYQAQKSLSARKQAVQGSLELLRLCKTRQEEGTASKEEVAQAREQYRSLRKQSGAVADVALEMERQLVALTGLGSGSRLRPNDRPSLTRARPDWDAVLREAVAKRPELRMARNDVTSSAAALSAGKTLEASLRMFFPSQPSPIPVRVLQLQLARNLEVMKDQEGKAQNFLELYYRRLSLNYKQIESTRAQREAFGELLTARKVQYATGRCSLAQLLEAQRSQADAQTQEYAAIGTYNNARAGFDFGKGTTLDRHRMVFGQR